MATLNFIKGTVRGKIGQFVGSSWKGRSYIKTFTKPGNPRTADQVAVRSVFFNTSQIAKAIYEKVLKPYTFPKPKQITAYNRMIQINKAMFESKVWKPESLKIFEGPLANPGITTAVLADNKIKVSFSPTPGHEQDRAIAIVYDSSNGAVSIMQGPRVIGNLNVPLAGLSAETNNLHAYLVFVLEPKPNTNEAGMCSETAYAKVA
ncbi:MAG: hypothetical protein FWC06_09180 [Treponema sp.]|nr:hypothetical protein [Treponema sp.]